MRSSLRFWLALSLLLVAGGIVLWLKGRPEKSTDAVAWSQPQATVAHTPALLTAPSVAAALGREAAKPENPLEKAARYQLKNVDQPIEALTRVDSAILMRNALIDTRQPVDLPIPADLRAGENPGAYIVQAASAPTAEFQNSLKAAGAQIVAYVPNNAFLVKAGSEVAGNLQNVGGVRSVLPYEPYYKLDTRLMKFAVDHETMDDDAWLRVTLFPGVGPNAVTALAKTIGPTEKSPFGQQILIQLRPGVLADIAQLAEVQIIEPVNPRVVANDLTRVRLGVSADTTTNANYLGLTGSNVWVNLNDIGVQSNHTALVGRVFYNGTNAAADAEGHGTHVAGTIIGNRATNIFDQLKNIGKDSARTNLVVVSDEDGNTTTNLYVDGSLTNADFRGIAHEAKLFVLPIDFNPDVNEPVTDTYLIETAARTNYFTLRRPETPISNNSWNYANSPDYDSQAARFDAAARDALPDDRGSQPVLYVFAAGNLGFGAEDGQGGQPGTISSPGSAKNVITVGALESPRFIAESITNVTESTQVDDDGTTNTIKTTNLVQIFRPSTDSDNQVASYSGRGNVGVGVEGLVGRFKPDVVAPGTFVWSARSKDWNLTNDFDPRDTNLFAMFNVLSNLNSISSEYRYDTGTSFSAPGVSGLLALVQEFFSYRLPVDRRRNLSPALMKALLLNAARSVNSIYDWDTKSQTSYQGWGLADLRNLITAAEVPEGSPARATLEQWQEPDWPLQLIEQSPTNAVATGEERVWNLTLDTNALASPLRFTLVWTDPPGNPQVGVKLVNDLDLTVEVGNRVFHGNDFPAGLLVTEPRDPLPPGELPINDLNRDSINNVEKIVIGNPQSLTTNGQVATKYTVKVSGRRVNVKAVNDYYDATGRTNEIVQDFALVMSADNFFVQKPFQTITRVSPVTVNTNVIVQPVYNGTEQTNQRAGANSPLYWTNGNAVQWRFYVFTNSPNTNGVIKDAGRYVAFITSGPLNIGKARNIEPDLDIYVSKDARLTNLEPAVLNDINNTWRSTTRLGTEQVVFAPDNIIRTRDAGGQLVPTTNTVDEYDPQHPERGGVIVGRADIGDVFYIGVKAEDQQAGEFSFIAISSQDPLEEDRNGIRIIHMLPAPNDIPDGAPNLPVGRRYFGVPLRGGRILDAGVYFHVQHEELGDLVGTIGHGARYATLNNHSLPEGFTNSLSIVYSSNPYAPIDALGHYNDLNEYPPGLYFPPFPPPGMPLGFRPDGPIDLSTYISADAAPVWTFDMADSAAGHTGSVNQAEIHVTPMTKPLINGETLLGGVRPGGANFYPLDVPIDASRVTLTLTLSNGIANTNILLLVGRDVLPSTNRFDYIARFTPGGPATITLTFDRNSQPPLIPGEYIVAVVNLDQNQNNPVVNYSISVVIDRDNTGAFRTVLGDSFVTVTDDARTISQTDFLLDRIVTDASVAILAPGIRESDYVFRLTSPQGTSVILSENRGWLDQGGFGSFLVTTNGTNVFPGPTYGVFTDNLGSMIKFTPPPFGDAATTRGFVFGTSFENVLEGTYAPPATLDGWTVRSNEVYAVWGDAAAGEIFVNLGIGGAMSNTLPTIKGRPYKLSFSYRGKPKFTSRYNRAFIGRAEVGQVYSTGQIDSNDALGTHVNAPIGSVDRHFRVINNPDRNFAPRPGQDGSSLFIAMTNSPPFPGWFANDTNSQWLALLPQSDDGHPAGTYTNRTSFVLTGVDPARVRVHGRVAADDSVVAILRNGVAQPLAGGSPAGYSQLLTIQGFNTGLNTLDFVVQNTAVGDEGFRAHLLMTFDPILLPGSTNADPVITNVATVGFMRLSPAVGTNALFSVSGAPQWQRFETEFIAPSDNIGIEFFAGATNFPGVDIDDIELLDTGTKFMLPEEPLAILKNERAMGEWKLEAIDNRTGDVLSDIIWDWQLILGITPSPRLAEALNSAVTYPAVINNPVIKANTNVYSPGKILGGETEYFYFDVCPEPDTTEATIELFAPKTNSIPLELLVDRSGFPTGDPDRDDYEIIRTQAGQDSTVKLKLTVDQPVAAPLRPGKRLFIAVRGAQFPQTTNETFTIRVVANSSCAFIAPTVLAAGQSVSSASFAAAPGDSGDRYQTTTTTASSVEFAANGPLTLLASNGSEPTMSNYQIKQTVSSSSVKIPLAAAGTWYFRIVNESGGTVPYTLSVEGQPTSAIRTVAVVDNHLTVTWQSEPGASYEIAASTDLVNWTPVTTVQADSTETSYTDPEAVSGVAKFIRIRKL